MPAQLPPPSSRQHQDGLEIMADKVFVHRWPHDTPVWDDSTSAALDGTINKNPDKKRVVVRGATVRIGAFEFYSLSKVGLSVPFFKGECRMIFEAQFAGPGGDRRQELPLHAHVHVTIRSERFVEIFNDLTSWMRGTPPPATSSDHA